MTTPAVSKRIDVADALRGFAVLGILLLHSIEHFNFLANYPTAEGPVLRFFDTAINDGLFFMFGGKAYAIFAMLFGFSFFIQDNNQLQRGYDFRGRFLWRIVLLLVLGNINSIFYNGDILVMFATVAWVLPLTARMKDKTVFWIAVVLMLQPFEIGRMIFGIFNPTDQPMSYKFMPYYLETIPVLTNGNFWETAWSNLTSGQAYSFIWQVEHGRIFQTASLFLFGALIGRRGMFLEDEKNLRFWARAAIVSVACFFPLNGLYSMLPDYISNVAVETPLGLILDSLAKFSFMTFLTAAVVLAFYRTRLHGALARLIPYGRMSLTMYMSQSLLGGFAFYGWGLGLAAKLTVTQSLAVAVVIFAVQYTFAVLWLRNHKQGPMEWLWKKATWVGPKR